MYLKQVATWQVIPRHVCTPYNGLLISVAFVVLCRVGCLLGNRCEHSFHGDTRRHILLVWVFIRSQKLHDVSCNLCDHKNISVSCNLCDRINTQTFVT